MDNHYSDCALHNAPAKRPAWCDCGGITRKPTFFENLRAWLSAQMDYFTNR